MATPVDTFEHLVARAAWIRKLARELVRDPDAAEDLAQEAWVAALEHPPEPGMPIRRWLAAVMRNFARDRWREGERRAATERGAARPEHGGDAALEQLEAHALLVEAVRGLDEPYRTTVVLRFLEELSPADVAARTGVPLRTVHTRTTRALAKLREKLDRRAGDRKAWLACLAPLLKHPGTPYLGALLVNSKLVGAAVAVAVLSTAGWWLTRDSEAARVERASDARFASERPIELDASTPTLERAAVSTPARPTPSASSQPAPPPDPVVIASRVRGVVIGPDDAPLAGLEVEIHPDVPGETAQRPRTRCDAHGAFEFDAPPQQGRVRVATLGYTTVYEPVYTPADREREFVLLAAPSAAFAGRVVDESARPLEGAQVTLQGSFTLRSHLSRVLDGSRSLTWTATTDAEGRFELPEVPLLPGGTLVASSAGFASVSLVEPERSTDALEFKLTRSGFVLAGQVVFPDGKPCPDAWVALGDYGTTSDADGRFRVEASEDAVGGNDDHGGDDDAVAPFVGADDADLRRTLRAVKRGWLPVRLECARAAIDAPGAWPEPLVLTLQSQALTIRGRVVDADGKIVPKAQIALVGGQYAGMKRQEIDGVAFVMRSTYEQLIAGQEWEQPTTATVLGTFEIEGLQDREYVLRATDVRSLAVCESEPIAAGTQDAVLRFRPEPRRARVAGRVESLHGEPVPHTPVRLGRVVGVGSASAGMVQTEAVLADDQGRFEFLDVAAGADWLSVQHVQQALDASTDLEAIRVVVPQRTHARIELGPALAGAEEPDSFTFLDADGKTVSIVVDHGGVSFSAERWMFSDRRSETMSVLETATTLVLTRGTDEVRRVPVKLALGELNLIRP